MHLLSEHILQPGQECGKEEIEGRRRETKTSEFLVTSESAHCLTQKLIKKDGSISLALTIVYLTFLLLSWYIQLMRDLILQRAMQF